MKFRLSGWFLTPHGWKLKMHQRTALSFNYAVKNWQYMTPRNLWLWINIRALVLPNETEIYLINNCRATQRYQSNAGDVNTICQLESLHLIDGIDALQHFLDIIINELYRQFLFNLPKIQSVPVAANDGCGPLIW